MSANCKSCGRIMTKPEDYSGSDFESQYCSNCTDADGSLKNIDEITLHIANQLIMSQGIDREAATKAALSILSVQPEWRKQTLKKDNRARNKLIIALVTIIFLLSSVTTYLLLNQRKNENDNAFFFTDSYEELGMNCYSNIVNDLFQTVTADGIKINQIPLELDQTNLKFKTNGFLEFLIDRKRNVQYLCDLYPPKEIQFCQGKSGEPVCFYSVPLSFDIESQDKYLGCITYGNILNDKITTYWLVDKPELDKQVIKEISDDPSGARTIGSPCDGKAFFCGNYVIWLEKNTANPVMTSVMGYNSKTKKVFPIDVSLTWKSAIQTGATCVYWVDSGNPNKNEYTVKGFDLVSMKSIQTGISLKYDFPYKYNSSNLINGKFEMNNPLYSIWCISGDDVVYEDVTNNSLLMMFSKLTNKTVGFSKSKYTPFYAWIIWWTWKDENDPNSKSYYRYAANHSFFTDTNPERVDPFCVWASKQLDGAYTFSYLKKSQLQDEPGIIENVKPYRLVGVTGDWFLWIEQDTTNQKNAIIKTYNLVTKQTKNLGTYELDVLLQGYHDIACFDNTVAWSAWNKDTGYDIYYAKLPEGK